MRLTLAAAAAFFLLDQAAKLLVWRRFDRALAELAADLFSAAHPGPRTAGDA